MLKIKMKTCNKLIARRVEALLVRNTNKEYQIAPKNYRGITLIALVITIIIMLILVGVSIRVALNGGLFSTAKQAKRNTKGEIEAEQRLSNGRIKVDGIWYDSIEDYMSGRESKDQNDGPGPWTENEDGSIVYGDVTLQVGDYVNYKEFVNKTKVNTDEIYNDLQTYSGYTSNDYKTKYPLTQEKDLKWRVLDVKNGNLRLISEYPTISTVYLNVYNGYNNGVYLIDKVCDTLYTTERGAAQNLKIEDIEDKIDITKFNYKTYIEVSLGLQYGEIKEYTENRYYPEIFAKEKTEWVDGKQGTEYDLSEQKEPIKQTEAKQAESKIKVTQTYWGRGTMQETDWKNKIYQNIFIKDVNNTNSNYRTYWLSSRCVDVVSARACLAVRGVSGGDVRAKYVYYSNNGNAINTAPAFAVRPVITLSSEVQIGEKDGETWQIK